MKASFCRRKTFRGQKPSGTLNTSPVIGHAALPLGSPPSWVEEEEGEGEETMEE